MNTTRRPQPDAGHPALLWLLVTATALLTAHSQQWTNALTTATAVYGIAGRTAAIRQHVLELPAPVIAEALGYHRVTTAKLASEAGGTWSRYAAGDHLRSPSGRAPQRTDDS
ncbi:hypothetical protein [Streptomyces alkaliphilus]|uniref:hypothetical protein n=1 Tax=Streptomyces alkaliphilus TaxID=1472722 RepID=UPI001E52978B|nr:hypothetical protein [Streptomyces alkaliphilus]